MLDNSQIDRTAEVELAYNIYGALSDSDHVREKTGTNEAMHAGIERYPSGKIKLFCSDFRQDESDVTGLSEWFH